MELWGALGSGGIYRHWFAAGARSRPEYGKSWPQWFLRGSRKVLKGIGIVLEPFQTFPGAPGGHWERLGIAGSTNPVVWRLQEALDRQK